MDIRNPEYILEIARQQSVTRAAEKLFVTQSTLSQYLLKLESELGTPLFRREKSGLVPTDAGQIYLQAARDIVRIQRSAGESIAALKNEGTIRLGCSSWGLEQVAELLPAFKERFPAVTLKLYGNSYIPLKNMMNTGKLDMSIIAIIPEDDLPSQGYTHLCDENLVLALPQDHPFCAARPGQDTIRREVLKEELRGVSYIFKDEGATVRRMEEKLFTDLMCRPNVVCEMEEDSLTLKMVAAGTGAAIVPLADARAASGVRFFRFDPPLCREEILVYRRDVEKTAAMACLEELLVARGRELEALER